MTGLSIPRSDRTERQWPVLALLLIVVLVPTVSVLWFMGRAMRNERLAVEQTLTQVYRNQLDGLGRRMDAYWTDRASELATTDDGEVAGEVFERLVISGVADSVVVYDSSGRLQYPVDPVPDLGLRSADTPDWRLASRLEFERADPEAAARAYATIVREAGDIDTKARALLSQARCLAKADESLAAVNLLAEWFADPEFHSATIGQGRLAAPNALLLALELMKDPSRSDYRDTMTDLIQRIRDYGDIDMPASQRRFLMERLLTMEPEGLAFPTLASEGLAADYLRSDPTPAEDSRLEPATLPGVWRLASPDKTVVALFRESRLRDEMRALIETELSGSDVIVECLPPGSPPSEAAPFLSVGAGAYLPGWRLALTFNGADPFSAAAGRQTSIYLWTGVISVMVTLILAGLAVRLMRAQGRLARLKHDLVATVSHELKTPLSSVRAVIDTVAAGRYRDEEELTEYIQIASQETGRLTRLIDNFLAFSRIERNKQTFEFDEVEIDTLVNEARDSMRRRFDADGHRLETEVEPNLPTIIGDRDALVTVLDNLLDNAYKYSGDKKRVVLRAYAENGRVCLEVEDNGKGLSRREAKKVFDRFYQVDQSSTRSAGGCGLGLSIVQFIVAAHGGSISVDGQPGQGTTFKVTLPVEGPRGATGAEGHGRR